MKITKLYNKLLSIVRTQVLSKKMKGREQNNIPSPDEENSKKLVLPHEKKIAFSLKI